MPSLILSGAPARYEPIMELGQSATSDVFLAVVRGLAGFNKLVVLKALKRELAADEQARTMFLNEARISARLNHPNIAQVNEVIEREGVPVIVMEYLQGRSLAQVLEAAGEKLPLALRLRVIADALVGLHYAHELTSFDGKPLGLVHRNVCPQNVFVTFDGGVKLLDFGIAKLCATAEMTRAGVLTGQLQYISPEQVSGAQPLDRRADLFAAGIMLWEVATGERFWKASTTQEILARLLEEDLPVPRTGRPDAPELLDAICVRALAREPSDRYATAEELRRDVEAVISRIGEPASNRELGTIVAKVFAESRAEAKRRIDERLRTEAPMSAPTSDLPPNPRLSRAAFTTASGVRKVSLLRDTRRSRLSRLWVPAAAGLVLVSGLLAWKALARKDTLASPGPPASTHIAPPQQVRVRFSAYPPGTQLWLDGKPLASNPFEVVVPSDGTLHQLRAEAPGHVAVTRDVTFLREVDIVLNLQALSAALDTSMPAAPVPAAPRYTAPAAPPPEEEQTACDPPFTVDSRGVKKYKPQCL